MFAVCDPQAVASMERASVGIEPAAKRYLILKSRTRCEAGFRAIAKHEIPRNGVGMSSSYNLRFILRKARRPINRLDPGGPERPNCETSP